MKTFTPHNHKFNINEHRVVLNGIIIWSEYSKKGYHVWDIEIGKCSNGLWDFGYSYSNGGSPICTGKYHSEEEVVKAAIKSYRDMINTPNRCDVKPKELNRILASLDEFKYSLKNSSEDIDLSQVNFNGNNEQLSLF